MTADDVERRFGEYLARLAECGRGTRETESLIEYFAVPVTFATDAGVATLASAEQVVEALDRQVQGMRASAYDHSDVVEAETTVMNAFAALHRAWLVRVRGDGSEIGRLHATYVLIDTDDGARISTLIAHGV